MSSRYFASTSMVFAIVCCTLVTHLISGCTSEQQPKKSAAQQLRAELLAKDPAQFAAPMDLLQVSATHSTVYRGKKNTSGFNLHSYLIHFGGQFWAMWSSSKIKEEDPDQRLLYAVSDDGHSWSPARNLASDPDGPNGPGRWIARGFLVNDGTLQALGAYVESATYGNRGQGIVWKNLRLMRFVWDEEEWVEKDIFADNCMSNFPPTRLGTLWGMACRDDAMNVSMALSDNIQNPSWSFRSLAADSPFDRMEEPTLYSTDDGFVHMIARDNNRSRRLIRVLSKDGGVTWNTPVLTNYPDATSKNFTGRFSNGTYFLINNPNPKHRYPLTISFSHDGWTFSNPVAIRKGASPMRLKSGTRGTGRNGFQYPHAIEHTGSLWVIYSTNKEDIEISEFKISNLF